MRREARRRTCRSENFFSSSRVKLKGGPGGLVLGLERGKGKGGRREGGREGVPLLDFVEAWEEGHGDEDDDCFLAVADFEL